MVKKAFLAAIDNYASPYTMQSNINDLEYVKSILIGKGFSVTTLINNSATKSAILNGMNSLKNGVGQGDHVVFGFFGHGSQQPNSSEDDGTAECLCAYNWASGGLIWDYEVENVFRSLPCEYDLFFNTCFSDGVGENNMGVTWQACRENEYSTAAQTTEGVWRGLFPTFFCWVIEHFSEYSRWRVYLEIQARISKYINTQHCVVRGSPQQLWFEKPFGGII